MSYKQQSPVVAGVTGDNAVTTNANTITLTGSTSGASFSVSGGTITESFNYLALPKTSSTDGQVTVNGTRFLHGYGTNNTFVGSGSGNFTLTGVRNVAVGQGAGAAITSAGDNVLVGRSAGVLFSSAGDSVAVGSSALGSETTGINNTAVGRGALSSQATGNYNTAMGGFAGNNVSTGAYNVFVGDSAASGASNTLTGEYNVIIGRQSATSLTGTSSSNIVLNNTTVSGSSSNTLYIGESAGTGARQLNRAFIHGIRGITTGVVDAIPVLVDSAGQLGTISSSIRFKENIEDMGDVSSPILNLRPVIFDLIDRDAKYKQVGLIAEEVDDIMPSLVARNAEGEIETVRYHDLPILLLAELKKAVARIEKLESQIINL